MKMLSLRFSNLNSLYGEWEIDFSVPEIQDAGVFAITGPTGSGKSTILDALCLALYGVTPRLSQITKSSNEVMSRNTGECYAELEYEMGDRRYLSRWSQKRARGKAGQKLQNVTREISEWNEERQSYDGLANKLKEVGVKVAEVTGMNFERFTRTIFLAQGNFAAFLKADTASRSNLLEQITGTDIYTKISIGVHERYRAESDALNEISVRMQGVQLLSDEERNEFLQKQSGLNTEVKSLAKKREISADMVQWLKGINTLEGKIKENEFLLDQHKKQLVEFTPNQVKLEEGKRAAKVKQSYDLFRISQTEEKKLLERQELIHQQINEQTTQLKEGEKRVVQMSEAHQAKEKLVTDQRLIWKSVRALDTKLEGLNQHSEAEQKKVNASLKIYEDSAQELTKLSAQKSTLEDELQSAKVYVKQHANDERAMERAEIVDAIVKQWLKSQLELTVLTENLEEYDAGIVRGKQFIEQQLAVIETAEEEMRKAEGGKQKLEEVRESHLNGKLLREYYTELSHLSEKKELEVSIQSLEEHRDQLIAGEECPLCGSKQHPFADDKGEKRVSKVAIIATEIRQVEKCIKLIEDIEKEITVVQNTIEQAELRVKSQQDKLKNFKARLYDLEYIQKESKLEKETKAKDLKEIEATLKKEFVLFSEKEEYSETHLVAFSKDLINRSRKWKETTTRAHPLKEKLERLETEIVQQSERVKSLKGVLTDQQQTLKDGQQALEVLRKEREAVFEDKSVDAVEQAVEEELITLREAVVTENRRHQEGETVLTQKTQSLESLRTQLEELKVKLVAEQKSLVAALRSNGFEDVSEFKNSLIDEGIYESLKAESRRLHHEGERLNVLSVNMQSELDQEKVKNLTDEKQEVLSAALDQIEAELAQKNQDLGDVNRLLRTHEDNLKRQEVDGEKLKTQQKVLKVWKQLHDLIGSSSGQKFCNYAQGLTFEWVVNLANKKLAIISDRYLLVRDKEEPLELSVLDNYQGGERRSTKNLSGGESFLISLALALGLSQMVGENIQMDSLFLDEGFGTLDDESLEVVMDALGELRQDGKMIGVISHVQELKDRITTQIVVTSENGGKSTLSGAGVV